MHSYNLHKHEPTFQKHECEKCGASPDDVVISEHHVYPCRWSFIDRLQDLCVFLCLDCHSELEDIIFKHERQFGKDNSKRNRLPNWFYPNVTLDFITK